jgi:hypothetical protein
LKKTFLGFRKLTLLELILAQAAGPFFSIEEKNQNSRAFLGAPSFFGNVVFSALHASSRFHWDAISLESNML